MEPTILIALILFVPIVLFLTRNRRSSKRVPPGSFGVPIIGQTFELSKAMKENRLEEWVQERARKYGPVSKLNFLGTPTVFLDGQALKKFVYTANEKTLTSKQPASIRMILGERNLLELSGQDHRRLRAAISSFLNPLALKQYVGKMDQEIRMHLNEYWHHNQEILVMPRMKTLTFNVISTLVFGIERGERRQELIRLFEKAHRGAVEFPINLPFTRFNRSMRASAKLRCIVKDLIREKRERPATLERPDLISSLINMRDDAGSPLLSDEEIIDNCILLMSAGHDTTSILLSFLVKLLAENPQVYQNVLHEQEEIARGKASGELLTWEDLNKMKYTWRVATETLRMNPPLTMFFRNVSNDFELGGYVIPKGWQLFWITSTTHMDESVFPDADQFKPSRFEGQATNAPYSYLAFGAGPRMCPGNEFARTETLTMIHHLVTGFQWKLTLKDNFCCRDPLPVFKKGLPVQVYMKNPPPPAI